MSIEMFTIDYFTGAVHFTIVFFKKKKLRKLYKM